MDEILYSVRQRCFLCNKEIGLLVAHRLDDLLDLLKSRKVMPACLECHESSVIKEMDIKK